MLKVSPAVIDPAGPAQISHDGRSTIMVKITGGDGGQVISVPPNKPVDWYPPAGWTSATFNAEGCDEVFRFIKAEATAE